MKPVVVAIVAAIVAAATSAITLSLLRDKPDLSASHVSAVEPSADLARQLEALRVTQAETSKALDDLRMQLAAKDAPARLPVGEIDAAVIRALAAHGGATAADSTDAAKSGAKPEDALDAKSVFAQLENGQMSREDKQALWKRAEAAGLADDVLAMFEAQAKERPNDPAAQTDLGHAYLQKVNSTNDGPEKGKWATMADQSFDKALALDDHNWDARFSKAVTLSFWPPLFGKQPQAIANFETLVAQQQGEPQQPHFAQTHLMLGNMYLQMGDQAKALAAWQHGLELFPDNVQLQQQIASAHAPH